MQTIDLDALPADVARHKSARFDAILYINALQEANTGDHFLALLSSRHMRNKAGKIAYLSHPNHEGVASFFGRYLDGHLVSIDPGRWLSILTPAPTNVHFNGLEDVQPATRDSSPLRGAASDESIVAAIQDIISPWRYFLLNRTKPAELDLLIPPSPVTSIPPRSVILFPERSDRHALSPQLLKTIRDTARSAGYHVYCNVVANSHFRDPLRVKNVDAISPSIPELVSMAQQEELFFVGTRSGIFDVLYFTSAANLIVFYPEGGPDFLYKCTFNNQAVAACGDPWSGLQRGGVLELYYEDNCLKELEARLKSALCNGA